MKLPGWKEPLLGCSLCLATLWLPLVAFPGAARAYVITQRWTTTASGDAGPMGAPATLTWSIVADGTTVPLLGGSNLVGMLDDIFQVDDPSGELPARAWFALVEQSFARWSAVSGINFVYEAADVGTTMGNLPGVVGLRGDVRIGGQSIDGSRGMLGYAYQPNNGDVVLDTSDADYFADASDNYRLLRNTLMHEIGHALGLDHVVSPSHQLLMERAITSVFDGPQLDDVRGAHALYGDPLEKANGGQGNDSSPLAHSLGVLDVGTMLTIGVNTTDQTVEPTIEEFMSIAHSEDVDYFSFEVPNAMSIDVLLTPAGGSFSQMEGGQLVEIDAAGANDLSLTILDASGVNLIASADAAPAGAGESLSGVLLPEGGEYYIRVAGSTDAVQLYRLSILGAVPPLPGDYNGDRSVDLADFLVWRRGQSMAADGNGNGVIDDGDYAVWRTHFGTSAGTGASSSPTPEPSGVLVVLWLGAVGSIGRRRRGAWSGCGGTGSKRVWGRA